MHFNGNTGFFQAHVIGQGLLHTVHFIVLVLEKECRWSSFRDVVLNVWLKSDAILGDHEVAGIDRYGEIRSAAHIVGCIHSGVHALFKMNACSCYEVAASGKADDADSIRVDVPLCGVLPCKANGSLGVIEGAITTLL